MVLNQSKRIVNLRVQILFNLRAISYQLFSIEPPCVQLKKLLNTRHNEIGNSMCATVMINDNRHSLRGSN